MKLNNTLKALGGAVAAAGTFLVTQTTLSVSVKDGIYIGLVFIAALVPGLSLPPAPSQTAETFNKPPVPPAA